MRSYNILVLINQPKEARILAKLSNKIIDMNNNINIKLVFTDYYTFYFQKQFLSGLKAGFRGEILTQEKIYRDWQDDNKVGGIDPNFLSEWSKVYCKVRTLEQLAKTNQWVYGNENSRYILKTTDAWKTKILHDSVIWSQELVSSFSPNLILSLGNETLPTNILFEISRVQGIPFVTIMHTRLKNYWILREDFAYGISKDLSKSIISNFSTPSYKALANEFIQKIVNSSDTIYKSASETYKNLFEKKRNSLVKNLISDLNIFIRHTYWRLFIHSKERPYKVKRVEQNLARVTLNNFRYEAIFYLRVLGIKFCGTTKIPLINYFLWSLHSRPESSVLVLGDGKDEIEELFKTANLLPAGYCLAVKEHPIMLGRRQLGFYRRIKKHKKMILIDPFVSNIDLIKKSTGVIGISGTSLLEAAFLNKPSCALGKPEFSEFLIENGWESANIFFEKVISSPNLESMEKILPYVAYVISNSFSADLMSEVGEEKSSNEEVLTHFAKEIYQYLVP